MAIAAIAFSAYVASRSVARKVERAAGVQLQAVAERVADWVSHYLDERSADVRLLATAPSLVAATRAAGQAAAQEQTKTTDEIARSATLLADAALHLTSAVGSFRLSTSDERAERVE